MIFSPLALAGFLFLVLVARMAYIKPPNMTQDRIVGAYQIDTDFYPGTNAEWQREHFYFKITSDDQFVFFEKLADGSYKTIEGKVDWYNSSPSKFRIVVEQPHPLIDEFPTLYRGKRKFYYVFDSEFGNMFYRKVK